MKFIHTADIHYGMKPDSGKPWAKERQQAVKNSIETIVKECNAREVDCLFIAGDLFHRQPLLRDLKEINYLFSTIPQVRVVIIAGNHDRISENSLVLDFPWSENVYYITSPELDSIYFSDINTEVFGFSYHTKEIKDRLLDNVSAPRNNRINILLAHGGDVSHLPFDKDRLVKSGFSYIALGHIHKAEVFKDKLMAYCGSPEPLDINELGAHGFYYGEVSENSNSVSKLEFVPSSTLEYISLLIRVSEDTTNTELLRSVADEISKRGLEHIYKLSIIGSRDPDIVFEAEALTSKFRIAKIVDESEPVYDFAKLFSEHSSDMIGFYINELNRENISRLGKKALHYGVSALLKSMAKEGSQ